MVRVGRDCDLPYSLQGVLIGRKIDNIAFARVLITPSTDFEDLSSISESEKTGLADIILKICSGRYGFAIHQTQRKPFTLHSSSVSTFLGKVGHIAQWQTVQVRNSDERQRSNPVTFCDALDCDRGLCACWNRYHWQHWVYLSSFEIWICCVCGRRSPRLLNHETDLSPRPVPDRA